MGKTTWTDSLQRGHPNGQNHAKTCLNSLVIKEVHVKSTIGTTGRAAWPGSVGRCRGCGAPDVSHTPAGGMSRCRCLGKRGAPVREDGHAQGHAVLLEAYSRHECVHIFTKIRAGEHRCSTFVTGQTRWVSVPSSHGGRNEQLLSTKSWVSLT